MEVIRETKNMTRVAVSAILIIFYVKSAESCILSSLFSHGLLFIFYG